MNETEGTGTIVDLEGNVVDHRGGGAGERSVWREPETWANIGLAVMGFCVAALAVTLTVMIMAVW